MTAPTAPEQARSARARPHWLLLGLVVVAVLALDQLTKWWAVNELSRRTIDIVWTLRFRLAFNSGTAFSLGDGRGQLIGLVAIAIVGVLLWTARTDTTRLGALSRGLIVGGALGNVADRLFRANGGFFSGRVVDFVDFQWWPVFNVADSAVVVGCILLAGSLLFRREPEAEPASAPEQDDRAGDAAHVS